MPANDRCHLIDRKKPGKRFPVHIRFISESARVCNYFLLLAKISWALTPWGMRGNPMWLFRPGHCEFGYIFLYSQIAASTIVEPDSILLL